MSSALCVSTADTEHGRIMCQRTGHASGYHQATITTDRGRYIARWFGPHHVEITPIGERS